MQWPLLIYSKEDHTARFTLLVYRPADDKEIGEVTDHELAVQEANLAKHFYAQLGGTASNFVSDELLKSPKVSVADACGFEVAYCIMEILRT